MMHQAYKGFGKMTTVTIKNTFIDPATQTESGFGFIHFETIEGARAAVNRGSCLDIGGVTYNAEFSKHLKERGEVKRALPQAQAQIQPPAQEQLSARPFIPWIIPPPRTPLPYESPPISPRAFHHPYPYPVITSQHFSSSM
jgi:hypothetical protein